jgi:hypothetical protein
MVMPANQVAAGAPFSAVNCNIEAGARDYIREDSNKALVQASFDRWKGRTGGIMQQKLLGALQPRIIT